MHVHPSHEYMYIWKIKKKKKTSLEETQLNNSKPTLVPKLKKSNSKILKGVSH